MKENKQFTSKIGFVMAAAGSAVGLGNLWRFPYLAAKYGGGTFLLVYLILVVTFGFTLMITEVALGRKTGHSALKAYSVLNKRWSFLGVIACAVPFIIFPYYCVIGGWVVKYFTAFVSGACSSAAKDSYFGGFISGVGEPILWLSIFMIITAVVVMCGVQKGIEKVSKILMPILILLSIGMAIYVATIPGAGKGLIYYFKPDLSKFSINVVLAALGQLFYSMSLAMGIMITYGSYMKKDDSLESSARQIELFDTGIAILAGMIIVPAVYAFSGGSAEALSSGPSLMFVTLPKVFDSMAIGGIVGTIFFILVLFAALTSAISLMETLVSILMEKLKIGRIKICLIVIAFSFCLAIPSSLGFGKWSGFTILGFDILDFFDFISNSIMMPIVALLTCIFVGYIIKPKTIIDEVEQSHLGHGFRSQKSYVVFVKYIAPVFLLAILVSSVLNALGIIKL